MRLSGNIAVIGLGNILLRDEGIGVHVVRALKERYHFYPEIDLIDGGTLGLDLLPFLENCQKVLFVDAVNFEREPGFVAELEDEDIHSALQTALSVHHIGLPDLLLALKWKGMKPEKICLIGIQPGSIEMGLEVTDLIKGRMDELTERILRKLREWDVICHTIASSEKGCGP